ncbi:type III pantothenate kinase [Ornithobacterium rhinotracheale]|uniref:type III pantothenate kinase n=1 Tax=Ornithobacterium rhinotracheale TaxID=28251 RepID=UPI00129C6510|nr:type III pantothenate kinase [Ornithobacterium rhinotracheale]MRI62449.1 type III pantothenate kinase [Ornithobacterium rhinotracheale]
MLLAVNIGNSNIRFGIANGHEIHTSWTINTKPYKTTDEIFLLIKSSYKLYGIKAKNISGIVIGSVVPHQTRLVAKALERIHNITPTIVDRNTPSRVVHHSNQMGTDLYANAVAAHELYQGKKIVVDFGTALTLTGIDEKGELLGVIIAPGVITSLKALVGNTAQLPDIELTEPKSVLGRDTETCMQSGMVYGYVAMVEGLIDRINASIGDDTTVISTGGLGHIYQPLTQKINIDDKLHTLKGLCLLYEFNHK